MSNTLKHHQELKNGVGKCSVPMFSWGCPDGFCDKPAYGKYIDGDRYAYTGRRVDGKFDGYVSGLACPAHCGPTCPGLEIEPGVWSGCSAHKTGAKDCPTCGDLKG